MSCNGNTPVHSWNDFPHKCPTDIRDLISYDGTAGTYMDSSTFKPEGVTWQTNTAAYGTTAECKANRTDDGQDNAEAAQWMAQHKIFPDDPDLPPALLKVAFLRAGERWNMSLEIALGGNTYRNSGKLPQQRRHPRRHAGHDPGVRLERRLLDGQ